MSNRQNHRRAILSGAFLTALVLLCGVLAVLQYHWIEQLSAAARDSMRGNVQTSLLHLNQNLTAEMTAACNGLAFSANPKDAEAAKQELMARFDQWKKTAHGPVFKRVALALPLQQSIQLLSLNLDTGSLDPAEWPAEWKVYKQAMAGRFTPSQGGGGPPPFSNDPGSNFRPDDFLVGLPIFPPPAPPPTTQPGLRPSSGRGGRPEFGRGGRGMFGGREIGWLIIEINPDYVRNTVLPEVVQRSLAAPGDVLDYQVEIVTRAQPPTIIYRSDPHQPSLTGSADASIGLWDPQQFFWGGARAGRRGGGGGPGGGGGGGEGQGRGMPLDFGHWQVNVRHRAGSLEAAVGQARFHNLLTSAGVLLLVIATAAALLSFTRRTQRLAELQMDFVAGVSHELRTPLTVIHTAAYNLQGKLGHDPKHVEKYGALIQKESGRLNAMVEQILSFATAEAGKAIQEREPMSVETAIDEALNASKPLIDGALCVLERNVEPGLPVVLGDKVALRHAIENLVINAAKYGLKGGNWIGVSAAAVHTSATHWVEIRVADRGPGIPREEQAKIFDPFFRGARAIDDQIRGTGLGLSLVKKIVEAHGGTIRVDSDSVKGTAFILRLPAAPPGTAS